MFDAEFSEFQNVIANNNKDDGVIARFYDKVIKTGKVNEQGLPVFENKCFVEIRIRDNNCDIYDQPADREKIQRFPIEYARYQNEKKEIEKGTPLNQFAFLTALEIETLKAHGIYTVESLIGLNDERALQLGLVNEKKLAKRFLDVNAKNVKISDFEKREEKYKNQIADLQNEIEKLRELVKQAKNEEK